MKKKCMKVWKGAIKGVMASAVYSGPTGTGGFMMVTVEGKLSLSYCWQEIEKHRLQEMTKRRWLDGVTNALMRQVRGKERLDWEKHHIKREYMREQERGMNGAVYVPGNIHVYTHMPLQQLCIVNAHVFLITVLLVFWNSSQFILYIYVFISVNSRE